MAMYYKTFNRRTKRLASAVLDVLYENRHKPTENPAVVVIREGNIEVFQFTGDKVLETDRMIKEALEEQRNIAYLKEHKKQMLGGDY
jgi:hypothetical protein